MCFEMFYSQIYNNRTAVNDTKKKKMMHSVRVVHMGGSISVNSSNAGSNISQLLSRLDDTRRLFLLFPSWCGIQIDSSAVRGCTTKKDKE